MYLSFSCRSKYDGTEENYSNLAGRLVYFKPQEVETIPTSFFLTSSFIRN